MSTPMHPPPMGTHMPPPMGTMPAPMGTPTPAGPVHDPPATPGVTGKAPPAPPPPEYARVCSKCNQSSYVRNGCCLNLGCLLSLWKQKPTEARERLFKWGKESYDVDLNEKIQKVQKRMIPTPLTVTWLRRKMVSSFHRVELNGMSATCVGLSTLDPKPGDLVGMPPSPALQPESHAQCPFRTNLTP